MNRTFKLVCLLVAASTVGVVIAKDSKRDWAQWRGPNRDGISTETGILKTWPENGPNVKWRAVSGDGYSGMSIVDNRLYTAYSKTSDELAVCLDAGSGQLLWQARLDKKFLNNFGNGVRSTPSIDGRMVYFISALGQLVALDALKGSELWKHDLQSEYGCKIPTWGLSSSPLVYHNLLLVDVGGNGNHGFMAFDKKTGKVIWETPTPVPGYSSPIVVNVAGRDYALDFTGKSLIAVDPATGKQHWIYDWETSYDVNAATPVFIAPDQVFISTGYGKGAAMLKLGKNSVQELWQSRVMRNHFASCIYVDGYLYGFDDATLRCVNAQTKESTWAKRGFGKGSLLYADGHLIVLSERGKLVLIAAKPGEYVEKASAQMLKGRCWTMPTLLNGNLFIRNEKEILCLKFSNEA